jgi:hypothetical protein
MYWEITTLCPREVLEAEDKFKLSPKKLEGRDVTLLLTPEEMPKERDYSEVEKPKETTEKVKEKDEVDKEKEELKKEREKLERERKKLNELLEVAKQKEKKLVKMKEEIMEKELDKELPPAPAPKRGIIKRPEAKVRETLKDKKKEGMIEKFLPKGRKKTEPKLISKEEKKIEKAKPVDVPEPPKLDEKEPEVKPDFNLYLYSDIVGLLSEVMLGHRSKEDIPIPVIYEHAGKVGISRPRTIDGINYLADYGYIVKPTQHSNSINLIGNIWEQ